MKSNKKIFLRLGMIVAFLMLSNLYVHSQAHFWYQLGTVVNVDRFGIGAHIEHRSCEDLYHLHWQLDGLYRANSIVSFGIGYRQCYDKQMGNWGLEHRPMANLVLRKGIVKNRSRVSLRIMESGDFVRFRNETTVAFFKPFYVAYELFLEEGKSGIYRDRKYVGFNDCGLNLFLMWQRTGNKTITVLGTYMRF